MAEVILYTTAGCHLCEQAKDALWPVLSMSQGRLSEVDVAESDALIERYGVRIPVLKVGDDELDWPFSTEEITRWLSQVS